MESLRPLFGAVSTATGARGRDSLVREWRRFRPTRRAGSLDEPLVLFPESVRVLLHESRLGGMDVGTREGPSDLAPHRQDEFSLLSVWQARPSSSLTRPPPRQG